MWIRCTHRLWLFECLLSLQPDLYIKLGFVLHPLNPRIEKAETGWLLWVWDALLNRWWNHDSLGNYITKCIWGNSCVTMIVPQWLGSMPSLKRPQNVAFVFLPYPVRRYHLCRSRSSSDFTSTVVLDFPHTRIKRNTFLLFINYPKFQVFC